MAEEKQVIQPIFIPELKIMQVMNGIVTAIRQDCNENKEEESFLYKILQGSMVGNYEFYTQAVALFTRKESDTRHLAVKLFFDAKRSELPTIHINLPSENPGEDGMGGDEGFQDPIFNDPKLEFIRLFNRRFHSNYQVIFTSNSSLEVITMYHVIRAGVIANLGGLNSLGLGNLSISGGDLQIHPDIIPSTVYARGMNLKFGYEVTVPALKSEKFYLQIFSAVGKPIIKD